MRNTISDSLGIQLTQMWTQEKVPFDCFMKLLEKQFDIIEIRKEQNVFFCDYGEYIAECQLIDNIWYVKF